MKITCPSCLKELVLDDAKVPPGPVHLKCPGCGAAVPVNAPAQVPLASPVPEADLRELESAPGKAGLELAAGFPPLVPGSPLWEQLTRDVAHDVLRRMGLVPRNEESEEDDEEADQKWALVVEDESIFQIVIGETLANLHYKVETAGDKAGALDRLSRRTYDVVTVDNRLPDDPEGGLRVLHSINGLPPEQRRRMFVAFISADLSTMDTQSAFILGANFTVAKKDIRKLDKILRQAIKEHDRAYSVFRSVQNDLHRQEA